MRVRQLMLPIFAAGSFLWIGSVNAQGIMQFSDMWLEADEFVLSSAASSETLTFDQRRPVRVCLGELNEANIPTMAAIDEPNDTPLRIEREMGNTIVVEAGTCVELAAKNVELSPIGTVEDGWSLHGMIQSRAPQS